MAKYIEAAPKILKALEDGETMQDAAKKASIHKDTLYEWINTKPDFADAVQRARSDGEKNVIAKVERSLLDLALGYEYEEVVTEYESKPNPNPDEKDKYIPVIKKQKRTKKRVIQSVEAIRFYLSNKCPEVWKNRTDGNLNIGDMLNGLQVTHVYNKQDKKNFPSSESEVDINGEYGVD